MKRFAICAVLSLCLLLPAAPTSTAEPTATTSVSIYTAKKWIRAQMRAKFREIPGSVRVGSCRHGYSGASGRHRVLCDTYFEEAGTYKGWCGWGRVVTYVTFYKVQARGNRQC